MTPRVERVVGIVGFVCAYVLAAIPNDTSHLLATVVSVTSELLEELESDVAVEELIELEFTLVDDDGSLVEDTNDDEEEGVVHPRRMTLKLIKNKCIFISKG